MMFEGLDEQIKHKQEMAPAEGRGRILGYAGAFFGTVLMFGGLYLLIFIE